MLTIAKAQTGKATQEQYQKNYQKDCTGCSLLKQNYQLKNESGYWKKLHQKAKKQFRLSGSHFLKKSYPEILDSMNII